MYQKNLYNYTKCTKHLKWKYNTIKIANKINSSNLNNVIEYVKCD